jgi:hypothetical protein
LRGRRAHCFSPGACERRNSALDFAGIEHVDRAQLNTERWRDGLERAPLAGPRGYGDISNDRRSRHARRDLFEAMMRRVTLPRGIDSIWRALYKAKKKRLPKDQPIAWPKDEEASRAVSEYLALLTDPMANSVSANCSMNYGR